MANPFPFVASTILTAAQLNGIGEAVSFTPTYTNFSLGNGSVGAKYLLVQKLVYVWVTINCGTTSAFTGTGMTISRPFTAASGATGVFGVTQFIDVSAGAQYYGPVRNAGTTTVGADLFTAGGTYVQLAVTGVGTPFTIATGDQIAINYVYEVA